MGAKDVRWEGKRDEMDGEVESWKERRSPVGEMEGREYRLKRSVLNHFTRFLSLCLAVV